MCHGRSFFQHRATTCNFDRVFAKHFAIRRSPFAAVRNSDSRSHVSLPYDAPNGWNHCRNHVLFMCYSCVTYPNATMDKTLFPSPSDRAANCGAAPVGLTTSRDCNARLCPSHSYPTTHDPHTCATLQLLILPCGKTSSTPQT